MVVFKYFHLEPVAMGFIIGQSMQWKTPNFRPVGTEQPLNGISVHNKLIVVLDDEALHSAGQTSH